MWENPEINQKRPAYSCKKNARVFLLTEISQTLYNHLQKKKINSDFQL